MANPFKKRRYQSEIILLCVRWYLRYALSYRNLAEIMEERGLLIEQSTIFRWVKKYSPMLDKECRSHLKKNLGSYRVDETYGGNPIVSLNLFNSATVLASQGASIISCVFASAKT